jgi:hypothetical protein
MVERGRPGQPIEVGKLCPGIGSAHVDGPDRFDPRPRRFNAEEAREITALPLTGSLSDGGACFFQSLSRTVIYLCSS